MVGVLALVAGFVFSQIWLLFKWRGAWRVAAAIPGIAFTAIVGKIIVDVVVDPTSHNLWPFEIVMWSLAGLMLLGLLTLARLIAGRPALLVGREMPTAG